MTMPDAHDPHERSRAANGSDIATLLRAFDNYNATPQGREVHIPAGATQSGHTALALAKTHLGLDVERRSIDRTELYIADELFMTGTAAHVTPMIEPAASRCGRTDKS